MKIEKLDEYKTKNIWVCGLYYDDIGNKPTRNVKPTLVYVNEHTSRYYDHYQFIKIKKNGDHSKTIINYKDNTSYPRNLSCFDNEEECIQEYKRMVGECNKQLTSYIGFIQATMDRYVDDCDKLTKDK